MKKNSIQIVTAIVFTKLFNITCTILFLITIFISSCKKETDNIESHSLGYNHQVPVFPPFVTSIPFVWVWSNKYVAFPADSSILFGYAALNNQNASYLWRKVAGPANHNIYNPTSLVTKVDNLEIGDYEFEITATDINGRTGRDTLNVYVINPGHNETIFKNLEWICPMGCSVNIENIYSFIPQNNPILVFMRPANSSTWLPASPPTFEYSFFDNNFSLYTNDANGKVDVKIRY